MRSIFQKLTTSTLRERIVQEIRDAILTGDLIEGERIVERNLAAQFATSLTAVREALIQLESEGFVIKRPNAATHVVKLSPKAAEKLFAARKVVEVFAVEEAARLATPEQVGELESVYSDLLQTARSNQVREFLLTDFRLHEKIWEIAGNEYLEMALRRLVLPLLAYLSIRILSRGSVDLIHDAESHQQTLVGIKANDVAAARSAYLIAVEDWLEVAKVSVLDNAEKN